MKLSWMAVLVWVLSCAAGDDMQQVPGSEIEYHAYDLIEVDAGKSDGTFFNRNKLIDDHSFMDSHFVDANAVQAFFEMTPYGHRSFLADFDVEGQAAAELIVEIAREGNINPMILVVKLQQEMSLVSRRTPGTSFQINHAMGCACPDDGHCAEEHAGFRKQLLCAVERFNSYLDDLRDGEPTVSGWKVGWAKQTLDDIEVVPSNMATAALYTYTPWVGQHIVGGNWLFWNIYLRYTRALVENQPNHRWIGSLCASEDDCAYDEAECIGGQDGGFCSRTCELICPESNAPYTATTFCVDLGTSMAGEPGGWCLAQCDESLFPSNDGCAEGFECQDAERFGQPEIEQRVCWPATI